MATCLLSFDVVRIQLLPQSGCPLTLDHRNRCKDFGLDLCHDLSEAARLRKLSDQHMMKKVSKPYEAKKIEVRHWTSQGTDKFPCSLWCSLAQTPD
jgi:hypothetical protein